MSSEVSKRRSIQVPKPLTVLALIVVGVAINFFGAKIANGLSLPLFLDTIGTILAAVLGGFLPGIAVGMVTNILNSVIDISNAYYGTVNVLIAVAAVLLSDRGYFKKIYRLIPVIIVFALIGGGLSSIITWLIYGMEIGEGISMPLALRFHEAGLPSFPSQLCADILYDVLDKAVACVIVFVVLKVLPEHFSDYFRLIGWQPTDLPPDEKKEVESKHARLVSLRSKVLALLAVATLLIVLSAGVVSFVQYRQTTIDEHIKLGQSVANLEAAVIDAERVDSYLALGEEAEGYKETEMQLYNILYSTSDIQYIYVYRILPDGCHVVFDLDTPDLEGGEPGEIVEFDESFSDYLSDLFAGRSIEPLITNDTYGWLLTIYKPLFDQAGDCVCYVCVDISMGQITLNSLQFLVKVLSLALGAIILILATGVWLAEYNLVLPVNTMAMAAGSFAYNSEAGRAESVELIRNLNIRTGDEIENLYHALAKTTEDSMQYIADIQRHSATISKMQNGLIMVLADMVESRDQCTGDHVRKTAAYAKIIMDELRREGKYTDELTDDFIQDVVNSAPLHDIGKIQVSDVLLNKPGRLTDEEFLQMQNHTVAGGDIIAHAIALVSDAGYLAEAKNLASFHHERWDGKGYPTGLSGEGIPLSARIMAVADVFDALVSRRSYKAPFPFEKAMNIIREEAGTHFDPAVAEAFMNAEAEVRRVEEEFSTEYESNSQKEKEQTNEPDRTDS